MDRYEPTPRTQVRRLAKRGVYDRDAVHAILDEAFICHVGFLVEGRPVVIPTAYGRAGEQLYVHGSAASRMLHTIGEGLPVCVTVTLVDGLVLARSAFHHSVNYRSVVIFGTARELTDPGDKNEALRVISEHVIAGRWDAVRPPNAKELKATSVLAIDLEEVSAKVRTGPPIDDEEDYAIPVWAGVLPFTLAKGKPVPDERLAEGAKLPKHVSGYRRV